jgi:hypothetical protein
LILNNSTLQFEQLHVGVNSLIGHQDLNPANTHGWEIGLANAVESGQMRPSPVYLLKTGQGGSIISQWDFGSSYYNTFLARLNAAKALLENQPYDPILWYTQGINGVSADNIGEWKTATIAHFSKIRQQLPGLPICFSTLPTTWPVAAAVTNTAIQEICETVDGCYLVSTEGATMRDQTHWDYAGMKTIAARMVAQTNKVLNKGGMIFF